MSTDAEFHKGEFEPYKPFKLEEVLDPDELKEFYDQLEQDEPFEQEGPFRSFRRDKQFVEIDLDKLVPFGNYSFSLFQGQYLDEMISEIATYEWDVDSEGNIKSYIVTGITISKPIIVRPVGDDKYEILDGHYRVAAARKLRSKWKLDSVKIPAIIKTGLTNEKALSYVSELNPIGLLLHDEIDILCDDYRKTEGFKRTANDLIRLDEYSLMTMDEYIEHFLLDKNVVYDLYESNYCMGNPYELAEEECTDEAVAREIIRIADPEREEEMEGWRKSKDNTDSVALREAKNAIGDEIKELTHTFTRRDGGYIQQLKKYLDVSLDTYDYSDIENYRGRAKILFFIYYLKNTKYPEVNILQMLGKPSMENNDNSFLGWETSNGEYIKFIKHEIEMEVTPILKTNIKKGVSYVVHNWGEYMIWFDKMNSFLFHAGCDCSESVDLMATYMQEPFTYQKPAKYKIQPLTPLGTLYLKVIQSEYVGQMYDLLKVHEQLDGIDYPVPEEYLEAMWRFETNHMNPEDIEMFFNPENVREKAKYIYLKEDVSKEERRKIRKSKEKVFRFLKFFNLADPFGEYNMMDDVTELLIISCLQVILLDKQNEIFDYTFPGFEGKLGIRRGKIHVQAALKTDESVYDALKVYWVRKVVDRSYANVGDSKMRAITSRFEKLCLDALVEFLKCATLEEMQAMSWFYSEKLREQLNYMEIAIPGCKLLHRMRTQQESEISSTETAQTEVQQNRD